MFFEELVIMTRPLFWQGVQEFPTFGDCRKEWLLPSTLGELENGFEGATVLCSGQVRARGNFVLATALFAVMDHIGSFLRDPGECNSNRQNIARVARRMPSLSDVHSIVATFGRNSLVHTAWPATMIVIQDADTTLRFGLNISAESDITNEHRKLYWKQYAEPLNSEREAQWVLKLRLNVYALLSELAALLQSGELHVDQQAFEEVKMEIGKLCYYTVSGDRITLSTKPSKRAGDDLSREMVRELRCLFARAADRSRETLI
ncbi:MAG: hypothetical protein IPH75_16200 [bacterium]|nr:hypothetical protein [bacterium]